MRIALFFFLVAAGVLGKLNETCVPEIENGCISFSVGPGTGCDWMCNYCGTNLGTSNYYFTDGVCSYAQGGCVGNPQSGKTYTCCSL